MGKKVLISGYYGFGNFGDDAILYSLVSQLKNIDENTDITVISNNPDFTAEEYGVKSIYKFDFKSILKEMKASDVFISGGGSLLQDVTSLKSLFYYLSLLIAALFFKVKTMIYSQGIGPIRNCFGRVLAQMILKRVDIVTVRDAASQEFLRKEGIDSTLTADGVWGLDLAPKKVKAPSVLNVGIQLRDWHSLNYESIERLAKHVMRSFEGIEYKITLISLQDEIDLKPLKKLESILIMQNSDLLIDVKRSLSVQEAIEVINKTDLLIAMRFHAVLMGLKLNLPVFAINYDPKVVTLANDAQIPFINVSDLARKDVEIRFNEILELKDGLIANAREFSAQKFTEARQIQDVLIKILKED